MIKETSTIESREPASLTAKGQPPRVLDFRHVRRPFRWFDYEAPTPEQIDKLGEEYHFHPLTLEDAKTFDQRAKLQDYGNYLFLSLHTFKRIDHDLHDYEVEVYVGRDYLITIHDEPLPMLDRVRERFEVDSTHVSTGPDYLLYVLVDEMVEAAFPILDAIDDEIDLLEDETIERATPRTLQRIFQLKQELIQMRRSIAPMREIMLGLGSARYAFIDRQIALYFRDVSDHLARIHELIETARDLLGSILDTYLSVVSNRLNEVMKRLTVIATIFLPISFLVGLGGINFPQFPFSNSIIFDVIMALLIIVPAAMLIYFWRKGWL